MGLGSNPEFICPCCSSKIDWCAGHVESERANNITKTLLRLLRAHGSLSAIIQKFPAAQKSSRMLTERLREVDKLKTNFLAAMSY